MFKGAATDADRILRGMARAMEYLEMEKIIHSDIKPGNILYSGRKALLYNFELAMLEGEATSPAGTTWYMPPEYYEDDADLTSSSDMWALGIVMLYLYRRLQLPEILPIKGVMECWQVDEIRNPRSPRIEASHAIHAGSKW
jgi:serine/threonine protein kinase